MKSRYLNARDGLFIIPISLLVGAGLAALQPGSWLLGWLGFSGLLFLGLIGLTSAWRWAGGGRTLAWMAGLALALRLAAGVATYLALPVNGYNVPDDKAGFVFTDAHRRDDQAWELAQSGKSLLGAFDKTYYTDQYGGLLALSALTYKLFSPDVHRPLIVLLLAALTAALGIPFFLKAAQSFWGEALAVAASWLSVFYPESVLTGGAQMREPFLLTFIAIALWGFARWLREGKQVGWVWVAGAIVGMLLVSPAVALATLILLGGWLWLRGEHRRIPRSVLLIGGAVIFVGVVFLAWSVSRQHDFNTGSPLGIILNWVRGSVKWVIYELERGSGQIQNVFSKMNPLAQFLFVIGYGIAQPVLPPAFFEPTTLTWHMIAIARSVGWYLVLPFLLYASIAALRAQEPAERRTWWWLSAFSWAWILICAIRAGGDQWDNPRYRLIFFGVQAILAGYAWITWRAHRDAWLPRILAVELVCVLVFGQWYVARYYLVGIHLPILVVLSLCISLTVVILAGGWLWDRFRNRRAKPGTGEEGYNSTV